MVATVARPVYHGRIHEEKISWPHSVLYDALMSYLRLFNGHVKRILSAGRQKDFLMLKKVVHIRTTVF
jgi:hypothetical protein